MRHNRTLKRKNRTQLYHHNRHASRQKKLGKKHSYLDLKTETDTTSALAMVNTTQKQNSQTLSSLASRKPCFVSLMFFTPAAPSLILPGHRHGSSLPTQLIPQIYSNTDDTSAQTVAKIVAAVLVSSRVPDPFFAPFSPLFTLGRWTRPEPVPSFVLSFGFLFGQQEPASCEFTRTPWPGKKLWSNPRLYSVNSIII